MGQTVFIDGGGNSYESNKKYAHLFSADRTYVFEPNPRFWDSYAVYEGPALTLVRAAIWTLACNRLLYLSPDPRAVASSLLQEKMCKVDGEIKHAWRDTPVLVPCVNFAKWLAEHVIDTDRVILKLDIEGAEIPVLWQLIETGQIKQISELYCEFHTDTIPGQRGVEYDKLQAALRAYGREPKPWD